MQIADTPQQLYLLPVPVTFTVKVNGKKLEAAFVSASFREDAGYSFSITFSDGHNDSYQIGEHLVYSDTVMTDAYCNALREEISHPLCAWNPETNVMVLSHPVSGKATNIWVVGYQGNHRIYFNDAFQFALLKKPVGWEVKVGWDMKNDEGTTIDEELIKLVKSALKYQLSEV